jgi:primosomal protein N' (replication factor Y)
VILELAIPVRLWRCFDYLAGADVDVETLQPGMRMQAPFGKRSLTGVLMKIKTFSEMEAEKLKPVQAILDEKALLTPSLLKLCEWVSDYYHHPIGEVVAQTLPKYLRAGKTCPVDLAMEKNTFSANIKNQPLSLNDYQSNAVKTITAAKGFQTFLLNGVTGSGKTEVYFQSIDHLLQSGKQILFLVPEISLTLQTVKRFEERFSAPVALLHSEISDKKKLLRWLQARAGLAQIIIGTRSAIFTPLANPGMIILDEEHDLSFKQQSKLRYSARDLAIVRGQYENIPVILGSATPSLESLYNSGKGKYHYLNLPKRAGDSKPPRVSLINLRDKRLNAGLSLPLLENMREHLSRGGQILLFLNRRGYASVLMCHHCGWMAKCTRCDSHMTLHFQPALLHCHHCGASKRPPAQCTHCHFPDLITAGQGTERIEQVIAEIFPEYACVRIDRDSTQKRGSMEKLLAKAHQQEAQILIGTQMLAKGHHFPHLTLVVIVDADSGLLSVDFRGMERMAQLLVQVAGRAGRGERSGEVIIQTHYPDHPQLNLLLNSGYLNFAQATLQERQQASLPPCAYLALLRAEAHRRETTFGFLQEAKDSLESLPGSAKLCLLGPAPAPMERCAGRFRGHLLLQAKSRNDLQEALKLWTPGLANGKMAKKVRWSLDIDPQELV